MTTMNNEDPANSSLRERCDTDAAQPVAWLYVGGTYGGELEEWEIEAEQAACDRLNEASNGVETKLPLYTADQMREAIAAERALLLTDIAALREALDEAATDCELPPLYLGDSATLDDIIRAGGGAAFVTGLARGLREARGSAAEKEQPQMTPATKRQPRNG